MGYEARPGVYFNAMAVPEQSREIEAWVCWLDVMGTASVMTRSLAVGANSVMKLHRAVMEQQAASEQSIEFFPAVDGVYILTPDAGAMVDLLKAVLLRLAYEFLGQAENRFRFIPRGGLAHGTVARGDDYRIGYEASIPNDYTAAVVLGPALTDAYESERQAPPFGVYVHPTARQREVPSNRSSLSRALLRWWPANDDDQAQEVATAVHSELGEFFEWAGLRATELGYRPEAIAKHRAMARQYFGGV
ncbi:MAG: hypothetical protein O3C25_00510 [Chloroflexi bacterium]|nr:hypothetical protein [Chloroflexota bacterium]